MNVSTSFGIYAILSSIIFGLLVGSAQWFILRRYQVGFFKWILATVLGLIIASTILEIYNFSYRSTLSFVFVPIISGSFLGTAQFIILRKKFKYAGYWIPANILAIFLMMLIDLLFPPSFELGISAILLYILQGFIVGVITGIFLIRLIILNEHSLEI